MSDQEDAVTKASFPGPRSDFRETEGFSYRYVMGFSQSVEGKCIIYVYYKGQKSWMNFRVKHEASCSTRQAGEGNNAQQMSNKTHLIKIRFYDLLFQSSETQLITLCRCLTNRVSKVLTN